jgi:MFS family permease
MRLRRVALASAVGTTVEWYDYFIYSTGTALVFGSQFFPTLSPASGTLAAFATLGVGVLARPIGGIVWGHLGDLLGRKAMLVSSLLLMGVATVGVGFLPTYSQIGLWAPILLLALRLLQGLSAGGEWGGAALMAVEHAPPDQRGWYGSSSQVGVPAGLILAQLVFFIMSALIDKEQFMLWGWRVPFLISVLLVGVGLVIRLRVEESPVFCVLRDKRMRSASPLVEVVRNRPREMLLASASFIGNIGIGYVFLAFLLSYGTMVLNVRQTLLLIVMIAGSVVWLASILVAARWSDRIGRKPVYLYGSVLITLWPFPFFLLVNTRDAVWLLVAVTVLNVGLGATYGPQPALFSSMFEPRYRYSGASVSYAVGAVLGGGFTPLIASALLHGVGGWPSIAGYMMLMGLISLAAVVAIREPTEDAP